MTVLFIIIITIINSYFWVKVMVLQNLSAFIIHLPIPRATLHGDSGVFVDPAMPTYAKSPVFEYIFFREPILFSFSHL